MSENPTLAPYVKKLERRGSLSFEARDAILSMAFNVETLLANVEFIRQGERPVHSSLVIEGFVSRHRTFKNGSRQILSFHVPGDMIDLQSALVVIADYGVKTNIATTLVTVDHHEILRIVELYPELLRAFWFDTLTDAAIFREWGANGGRRSATARTAHLILEIADKMRSAGLTNGETFSFPVSQHDLADAVGITSVHINRVLQKLRGDRLIRTYMRTMTIEDEPALRKVADFDPIYLHREGPRQS